MTSAATWVPQEGDFARWNHGGHPLVHIVTRTEPPMRAACGRSIHPGFVHASEQEADARPCPACWEAM